MSKPTEKEDAFQTWYKEFLASVPAESREAVQKGLESADAQERLKGSVLMQADYTKKTQELATERKKFETDLASARAEADGFKSWYQTEAKPIGDALAAENLRLKQALLGPGNQPPTKEPPVDQSYKNLEDRVDRIDTGALQLTKQLTNLTFRALKDGYNEFDADKIIDYVRQNGVSPDIAYERLTAPMRAEKEKERVDKLIAAAKDEGRTEALAKFTSTPDAIRAGGPADYIDPFAELKKNPDLTDRATRMKIAMDEFNKGDWREGRTATA